MPRTADRIAFKVLGVYAGLYLLALVLASPITGHSLDLLDVWETLTVGPPILALVWLVGFQCRNGTRRFSLLANVAFVMGVLGIPFLLYLLVMKALAIV